MRRRPTWPLAWTLPAGLTAGDIVWPTPHRFEIPPLVNYGYAKHVLHLVKITAAGDLKAGAPLALAAKASWLVCSDVCIPESADLHLRLPVRAAVGAADAASIETISEASSSSAGSRTFDMAAS